MIDKISLSFVSITFIIAWVALKLNIKLIFRFDAFPEISTNPRLNSPFGKPVIESKGKTDGNTVRNDHLRDLKAWLGSLELCIWSKGVRLSARRNAERVDGQMQQ